MNNNRAKILEEIISSLYSIRRMISCKEESSPKFKLSSSQWESLRAIKKNPNIKITELAEKLSISNSAVSQLVDELVKKGYITRERLKDDRRMIGLAISSSCKKQTKEMQAKRKSYYKKIFESLTDEELKLYARINKKIIENS
jgi:DNA-binding MarR family transcriptional regulator